MKKKIKNPLRKRYLRDLKQDLGKYLVIFLFMVMLISLVSGFLVADNNFHSSYNEGFEKYNLEDGHITFSRELPENLKSEIEEKADLTFYPLNYFEETVLEEKNLRVYADRETVDTECVMEGSMPENADEIALDRLFAENAGLKVGDTLKVRDRDLLITGTVALVDYSCLFENNSDMMFDAIGFGVGIMTEEGYREIDSPHQFINYAWKYRTECADDTEADQRSEHFTDVLEDVLKEYNIDILQEQVDAAYDQAEELGKTLENQLTSASEEIEERIRTAAEKEVEEMIASQDLKLMGELDTTELAAEGLGTSKRKLNRFLDALEEVEEQKDEMTDFSDTERIDLHDLDDDEEYENNMDFSFDALKKAMKRAEECGVYDPSEINSTIEQLEDLMVFEPDETDLIEVKDYVPRYENNAVNFTGEDMGSDAATFTLFNYIVVVILAFVFAVTISNTITREAGVIGTLRASGYSRRELILHYLTLPVWVTLIAALIGNILGYTVIKTWFVGVYYTNYSLATYNNLWNWSAFLQTTVVPVVLMFVINLLTLVLKMRIPPLQFLRRELSRSRKKRAIPLKSSLSFMHRFRLRILFQNIPAYLTMFVGIFLGAAIVVFGTMFPPLIKDYSALVKKSMIAQYQYVLKEAEETSDKEAEKYCLSSLEYTKEGYLTDTISVYGIQGQSSYVDAGIPEGEVLISSVMADKFNLSEGDEVVLDEQYSSETYSFTVGGVYTYDAGMAVFMNREQWLEEFDEKSDYYTGYFSDSELKDIDEDNIVTVITDKDMTKIADQLNASMGEMFLMFQYFGVIMFLLMMYLMTKQIIEKNMFSISLIKILGYDNGEISRLYLILTSVVVGVSLLASIPLIDLLLRWCFKSYMYTMISGYIPYIINPICYVEMVIMGVVSYILICLLMMRKISRIPKGEALKAVE